MYVDLVASVGPLIAVDLSRIAGCDNLFADTI